MKAVGGDDQAEWESLPLGELGSLVRGVTYKKAQAKSTPEDGYLPLLRATNIGSQLDFDDPIYIPAEVVKPDQILQAGDVLIAMSSGSLKVVGKSAPLLEDWVGTFGAFCAVFRPGPRLHPGFVSKVLASPSYRSRVSELAAGANINNLKRDHLLTMLIPVPPFDEQSRIVATLDAALFRIEKFLALKQATQKMTLLAFRRNIDVVLDEYSKDGERVELSELAESITDGDHGTPPKAESGVPFITISNIDRYKHSISLGGSRFVPQEYFDGLKETRKPKLGDLLLTTNGTLGIPAVVTEQLDFSFQRDISLIRPLASIDPYWLSYSIQSARCQNEIFSVARGAAQQHLYLGELRKIGIPLPVEKLQQEAVEKLRAIEDRFLTLLRVQESAISMCLALRNSFIGSVVSGAGSTAC